MALVSNILTQVFITLIAVAGVYVLTGLTGMFSLGQAAFMAIGSYASGLLVVKAHMPLVPAIIIAVALATLVGYLIGYPVVRLRRDYISLVTLGFGEAIAALLNRMTSLTGGASGFTGIPRKTTLTIAAVSAVLAIALVAFFKSSKYGRQCIALRGDELAAKAMGINVIRIKMTAFLLSVALTAYSGCLYAFYMSYVDRSPAGISGRFQPQARNRPGPWPARRRRTSASHRRPEPPVRRPRHNTGLWLRPAGNAQSQ